MKDTYYSQIVREFSEISVQIKIGQNQYENVDMGYRDRFTDELYIPSFFDFWVKFQTEEFIFFNPLENFELSYSRRIDQLRDNFYQEIKDELFNNDNNFKTIYQLTDYKIKFQEIKQNYYLHSFYVGSITLNYLCNKSGPADNLNGKIDVITLSSILHKYYQIQLTSIDNILKYLELKINLFEKVRDDLQGMPEKTKSRKTTEKRQPKSFNLDIKKITHDVDKETALQQFKEALVRGEFIEKIDTRNFIKVFSDEEITMPIKWIGYSKDLAYLIRKLHGKKIIIPIKQYWIVTCICFIAYQDRDRQKLSNPGYLVRIAIPKKHIALDSALDVLLSSVNTEF